MRFLGPGDGEAGVSEGVTSAVLADIYLNRGALQIVLRALNPDDHVSGSML